MTIAEFKQILIEQGVPDNAEIMFGEDSDKVKEISYLSFANIVEIL